MPVLSPHRSGALTGNYRSTSSSTSSPSSTTDRPYYNSTGYNPRITSSYSERFTTRSYTDSDGRRCFSRSGSITEDGVTTRFREDSRDFLSPSSSTSSTIRRGDSVSRDSSVSDYSPITRRDSSLTRDNSRLSSANVIESVAELRNKYSPANYIPACQRNNYNNNYNGHHHHNNNNNNNNRKNHDIGRSKSINDIGLPPIDSTTSQTTTKHLKQNNKVNNSDGLNLTTGVVLLSNNTNNDLINNDDGGDDNENNNNRTQTVADLRKKFDEKSTTTTTTTTTTNGGELDTPAIKISENLFKKQDHHHNKKTKNHQIIKETTSDNNNRTIVANGTNSNDDDDDNDGGRLMGTSRVNHFASYIPSKDYQQQNGDNKNNDELNDCNSSNNIINNNNNNNNNISEEGCSNKQEISKKVGEIGTSPKLSLLLSTTNSLNNSNSNSLTRRSIDRCSSNSGSSNNDDVMISATSSINQLGLNGLKNIGNTCFMNSVIQCLSNTKLLLEYLLNDHYLNDINVTISGMKGALIRAFVEVIKELWSNEKIGNVINTTSLKSQIQRFAPRFIGYAQQDAQEFLRYLLEGLHEDVNRIIEKPKLPIINDNEYDKLTDNEKSIQSWSRYLLMDNSKIVDYFVGQLKSTLKCTYCGHCSVTFDPFWDLSLPIPQRIGQIRLSQCLDSFTREETLDGDEKPTCSKCKERRKCTKSFTIQKFPKILVIHLKRFSLAERFRGKLSVTVDFPLEGLDMSNYASDNNMQSSSSCRYNLYAVSNHSGTTYSGHYTAYCRHPYSRMWHEYNDSRVSPISSKSIVSGEAYVLFYEQDGQKSHL